MGRGSRRRENAEDRREQILTAAIAEFAARGLRGASIEAVAAQVGVSQPYVYKLFGTKKELFLAAMARVRERVQQVFAEAAASDPEHALDAMARSYDRRRFGRTERLMLLQGFAAADDPEVRNAVGDGYAALWRFVRETSGAGDREVFDFFAAGMLLTVDAAVGLMERLGHGETADEEDATEE